MALSLVGSVIAEVGSGVSVESGVEDGAVLCSEVDSTAGEVADGVLVTCSSDIGEVTVADSDVGELSLWVSRNSDD